MGKARRLTAESLIVAAALAMIGVVGGWASGAWTTPAHVAEATTPTQTTTYGSEPEADARVGVPDVCSRRIGCLAR